MHAALASAAVMLCPREVRFARPLLLLAAVVAFGHCFEGPQPALSIASKMPLSLEQLSGAPVQIRGQRFPDAADWEEHHVLLLTSISSEYAGSFPLHLTVLQHNSVVSQLVSPATVLFSAPVVPSVIC